jgi:hypothetical protein
MALGVSETTERELGRGRYRVECQRQQDILLMYIDGSSLDLLVTYNSPTTKRTAA